MAFLMLGIYNIISSGSQTKDIVVSEDRDFLQVMTALDRMEKDIQQIYSPLYHSFIELENNNGNTGRASSPARNNINLTRSFPTNTHDGYSIPIFVNEDKTKILFLSKANRRKIQDNKESRLAWIKYNLESDPRGGDEKRGDNMIVRSINSLDPFNPDIERAPADVFVDQKLAENIKTLSFEFWDHKSRRYVDRYRDITENPKVIRAIKVKLTWINESNNEVNFERVIRPLYAYFDIERDRQQYNEAKKPKGATGSNGQQNPAGTGQGSASGSD